VATQITNTAGSYISNQGPFRAHRPWGRVVHSLECDATPGVAWALSQRGGYLDNQHLAPHRMTDPTHTVSVLPTNTVGGHVGGRGNPLLVGYEVTGRAAWTEQQWMDGGLRQQALEHDARIIAEDCVRDGWGRDEIRWLSGAQIRQNYTGGGTVRGLLEHNDVSQFIGGTTHWDPGSGFPSAWFLARVRAWYDHLTGTPDPPTTTDWFDLMDENTFRAIMLEERAAVVRDTVEAIRNTPISGTPFAVAFNSVADRTLAMATDVAAIKAAVTQ
jgi:hypothetical protein